MPVPQHLHAGAVGRQIERGEAVEGFQRGVGAGIQKQPDDLGLAGRGGVDERGGAVDILAVERRTGLDQGVHTGRAIREAGEPQRAVAVGVHLARVCAA